MNTPHYDQVLPRLVARSGGRAKLLLAYSEDCGFHLLWRDHLTEAIFEMEDASREPLSWEHLPAALQSYLAEALPETTGEATQELRPYFPASGKHRQYQVSVYHEVVEEEGAVVQYYLFCFDDASVWIRESQETLDTHKLESIGELASGVAHDFNNLIMGIQSNAEALLSKLDGNPEAQTLAVSVVRACSHGTSLTRSLLGYAKRQPLSIHDFDLVAMVNDIVKIARLTLDRTGHHIVLAPELTAGAEAIHVEGCYSSLSHCMLNLLKNAREAMPEGGPIHITTHCDGNYARVSVRDHGVGIPEAELPNVFEPFYSTKTSGTGLGLSMVRGIMSQHSGNIEIASTVGDGTEITLIWPRNLLPKKQENNALKPVAERPLFDPRRSTNSIVSDARDRQIPGPKKAASSSSNLSQCAWIIDDDELVRCGVEGLLGHLKYETRGFTCAEDALAAAQENGGFPKLILVDYNMPSMTGADFIRTACEKHPGWMKAHSTRILLVSGFPPSEFQSLTSAYGEMNVGMLQKPFSMQTLQKKLAHFESPRSLTTQIRLPKADSLSSNPKSPKPRAATPRVGAPPNPDAPKVKARVRTSGAPAPSMPKVRIKPSS